MDVDYDVVGGEERWTVLGENDQMRVLIVVFTTPKTRITDSSMGRSWCGTHAERSSMSWFSRTRSTAGRKGCHEHPTRLRPHFGFMKQQLVEAAPPARSFSLRSSMP